LTYKVKSAASVLSWTDSVVTSKKDIGSNCGAFTWDVTQTDGVTPIKPDVFPSVLYNLATNAIAVETTDFSLAGTYRIQVKVWYSDFE